MTERSHKGLVQRQITVRRGGKSFKQMRWVKPGDEEPKERKGKKEEVTGDSKGKGSYKIGEQFNFLGDKYIKVEKVSESERTVKLSNGFVYTFEAIEAGKKGISGGKYNIGDKVNYNGKEHTITRIEQVENTVELDNMGSISEKDLNPKEKTIKNLKPKPKKEKTPKIVNTDKLTKQMESFESGLVSHPDGDNMIECISNYTVVDYMVLNQYLKDELTGDDEKIDKRINHIDTFLKSAPKMKGTVYRGMKFDDDKKLNKFLKEIEEEKSFKFRAFTSTSTEKGIAEDFGGEDNRGIIFEIKSKSGVYLNGISKISTEHEVLFNKNSKFNIINIDKTNPENVKIIVEEM